MAQRLNICVFEGGSAAGRIAEALSREADVAITGRYADGDRLIEAVQAGPVDVAIIDMDAAGPAGLGLIERVCESAPQCAVIGVGSGSDPQRIIAAMRAGCAQFVPTPIDPEDLHNALERVRSRHLALRRQSCRVCVVGSSGGTGATTIACNLALELGHLVERHVALVDLDLEFGDVSCAFDCKPRATLADACRQEGDLTRSLLGRCVHELPCHVAIVPRPEALEEARLVTRQGVARILRMLGEQYPFVVVDLPRRFSEISAAAVQDAEYVLVVTQLTVPQIRNADRMMLCLRSMGAPDERIQIVLNRCQANFGRITPEEVEAHFGRKVFALIPNDYRHVQRSLDLGHPIMADAPSSPARMAIQEMAKRIAGLAEAEEGRGGGLLQRLLRRPVRSGSGGG